ncbi:MAG: Zn-dependent hydrolase [Rhodospirillales bacterium]|nr:Zn-dependent hydrolase [Rhodospirillales bacterium]
MNEITKPAGKQASAAVNEQRLWQRHVDMAKFGATPKGGVNRQALSAEDIKARALFAEWVAKRGFELFVDEIGNLFVRRPGTDPNAAPVLSGSHMDSQPTGGRFDGIYGVLAAFEALEAIDDAGIKTKRPLEAAAWTNEEGARFAPGCMGSLVYTKPDRLQQMLQVKDAQGTVLKDALAATTAALPKAKKRAFATPVDCFIEAHIEQGPILEAEKKTIGVVTGIQGSRRFKIEVIGQDDHAGTTPRARRKDALSAAVHIVAGLEKLFHWDKEDVTRFTVGRFVVEPNAPSVVPGYVWFTIDFRDPRLEILDKLGDQVEGICQANARKCEVKVTQTNRTPPIGFKGLVADAVLAATQRLGYPHMHIFSGAGHDAQHLFNICPTGMIFVPCERGISHNEIENAAPADLAAGARVLADVMVDLANR